MNGWMHHTTIYEVNLRQYTEEGTIRAFARHLPRLRDMGVETLWFMPITPIAQKEKKGSLGSYYACADYTSVDPEFGTLEDFKWLVKEAHTMDFKVILDWVANHTGWDHRWTTEHPDWYERDEATGDFKRAYGMDDIIELDYNNPAMRRAMIDALAFWVKECDLDGFRCDLAFWVELHFWKEAIPKINELKPLLWLAEMDPLEHPHYMEVFDAAYAWSWMHGTEKWAKEKAPLVMLQQILTRYRNAPGLQAWFTSNHDENSWNGTEYEKYGGAAQALAVHSCTWPGIPLVYTGQEIPNGRRLQFFDKDHLQWPATPALHEFYKTLFQLKRRHPALHAKAEVYPVPTSSSNVMAYLRKSGSNEVLTILNLSPHHTRFDLQAGWLGGNGRELFNDTEYDFSRRKDFELKAWDYRVYIK